MVKTLSGHKASSTKGHEAPANRRLALYLEAFKDVTIRGVQEAEEDVGLWSFTWRS